MTKGRRISKCPACQEVKPTEKHHLLPRRWYGNGRGNDHIVCVCTECHQAIERTISVAEKRVRGQLKDWQYFAIVTRFIKERST